MSKIVIFISEGLVNEVYDETGPIDHHVVDFDSLENGLCPVCWDITSIKNQKILSRKVNEVVSWKKKKWVDEDGVIQEELLIERDEEGNPIVYKHESETTSGGIHYCPACGWDEDMDYQDIYKSRMEAKDGL